MQATRRRSGTALALLAPVLLLAGCGGGDDDGAAGPTTTTAPTTTSGATPGSDGPGGSATTGATAPPDTAAGRVIEVTVRAGEVVGGVRRERVELGEPIVLRVESDTADEVHVHVYDRKVDVAAGGVAEIAFTPDIPGVFEVELEESKLDILQLEVR